MKVCLGGTFSIIHAGHEALLRRACKEGDQVMVGLTSDTMAHQRGKDVPPYEERKKRLQEFVRQACNRKVDIVPLDDEYGPAATGACDAIVVSPETAGVAEQINHVRRSHDIPPLQVIAIPYVLADDGIPISSSRISIGEIQDGHRLTSLQVSVGTANELKRTATEVAFQQLLGHLDIQCTMEPVKTPGNPAGEQVWDGARHRAEQSIGSGDYGVGIEAGIVTRREIAMLEHVCLLVDSAGYTTRGASPAFQIPSDILESLREKSISEVVPDDMESLAAYLSQGTVTRKQLVQEAVAMA
ncbi:MAG: pantetheine-phosphate adenylyltransferase, partial [Candidatus Thermoplasmatota archaeon]|nr:pantetheine-phosphate adenylyltransferase [Candidatus Thermoplasmatota archaeon]